MALYVLAPVLLLGIPFLLYCLWNFTRELKPRNTRVFVPSRWPTWASAHPTTPMSLPKRQDVPLKPVVKGVDRPDRDYLRPARVS
jgi:hypothetical protein